MAVVTPADRPKSVRNRCVIEVFGGVLYVVTLLFGFSVGVRASVIGLSQISSFSLLVQTSDIFNRPITKFDHYTGLGLFFVVCRA